MIQDRDLSLVYTSFPSEEDGRQVLQISVWTKLIRVSGLSRDTNMGLLVSDNSGLPIGIIQVGHRGNFVQVQDGSDDVNNLWWSGTDYVDPKIWNKVGLNLDTKNHLVSFLVNDRVIHTGRHLSDSVRFAGLFSYGWQSANLNGHPRILIIF
ncbi:MAG: hypothetical protein J0L93_03440 [Deltaproteobacteria bacterium]|nr:hypothetical protein [Deltaproteobacteria bacterium]